MQKKSRSECFLLTLTRLPALYIAVQQQYDNHMMCLNGYCAIYPFMEPAPQAARPTSTHDPEKPAFLPGIRRKDALHPVADLAFAPASAPAGVVASNRNA